MDDASQGRGPDVTSAQIEVDFPALIELLSHHLYRDKSAAIRELLSNANDSLIARREAHGFGEEEPAIRIWLDPGTAQLVVKDNGVGMSKNDLTNYLSKIGASLTRQASLDSQHGAGSFESRIGRFGVGFLSSFVVAERITVHTRKEAHPGLCWMSEGRRDYTINETSATEQGTKVSLDLISTIRNEWTEERIKSLVLTNARYFEFPIYWGPGGSEKLNNLQAPWYQANPSQGVGASSDVESYRGFLVEYDDRFASVKSAMDIIPLHDESIRGVLYIPSATAIQHERTGVVDVFCKRVFVKEDHPDLIPKEFRFLRGIVDCAKFQLTVARDDIHKDNLVYRHVRHFLGQQVLERLCELAKSATDSSAGEHGEGGKSEVDRMRLETVMTHLHIWVKRALVRRQQEGDRFRWEDRYLTELEEFILFQSSNGTITSVPDYLRRQAETEREILFVRPEEQYTALRAISEQENREFLVFKHEIEEPYLKRYCKLRGIEWRPAVEALSELPKVPVTAGWEHVVTFYQEQLNHPEYSLSVYLSEFEPASVCGRLVAAGDSEGQRRLKVMVDEIEKDGVVPKDDPLLRELAMVRLKRPHFLYVNRKNPVLARLVKLLTEGRKIDLDTILHPIFHDIAIAAGHPVVESHLAEYQTRAYGRVLEGLTGAATTDQLSKRLSEETSRAVEATKRTRELQAEVERLREECSKRESEATALSERLGKLSRETTRKRGTRDALFFIRSMRDPLESSASKNADTISRRLRDVCGQLGLDLIDPKELQHPGNILNEIVDHLRECRCVVADITEATNANVYYEAGFVHGTYDKKLILIAEEQTVRDKELPFDFAAQRVLDYSMVVDKFDDFMAKLKGVIYDIKSQEEEQ